MRLTIFSLIIFMFFPAKGQEKSGGELASRRCQERLQRQEGSAPATGDDC